MKKKKYFIFILWKAPWMPFTFACFKNFHFEIDFDFLSVISISFDKQLSLLIMFSFSYSVFHAVRSYRPLISNIVVKFVVVFFSIHTQIIHPFYFVLFSHHFQPDWNVSQFMFLFYSYSKAMNHFISFSNEADIFSLFYHKIVCALK